MAPLRQNCSRPSLQSGQVAAGVDHAADAGGVADLEALHLGADGRDAADDLVPRDAGVGRSVPLVAGRVEVGVADATPEDVDPDVLRAGVAAVDFHPVEGKGGGGVAVAEGLDHGRSPCGAGSAPGAQRIRRDPGFRKARSSSVSPAPLLRSPRAAARRRAAPLEGVWRPDPLLQPLLRDRAGRAYRPDRAERRGKVDAPDDPRPGDPARRRDRHLPGGRQRRPRPPDPELRGGGDGAGPSSSRGPRPTSRTARTWRGKPS